jgi:GT2 family glycosyltransferase
MMAVVADYGHAIIKLSNELEYKHMIDLTILVCSVHTRYKTFLPKIQDQLYEQYAALSETDQDRVEIIILTDNKKMMLGHKRNVMVDIAQGKYVAFVDDDDRIAPDYMAELLKGTESDADCIAFQAEVSLNGEQPKICYYSKDVKRDYNHRDGYYRIPNHICCVKRSVSLKSSFPNVLYGEDAGYGKVLLPFIKTEHKIDKVLYYYDYNSETTETQAWRNNKTPQRPGKALVDVIILSKATKYRDGMMTQKAIDTCIQGSNGLPVNIIVMEGGIGQYRNAATIPKRAKFNYNQFANEGAALGKAEWIVIANNDLTFNDGWLHNLIAAGHQVVSPHEPNDARQKDITENTQGDVCGKHFSGWCFMISRKLWQDIGGFDTDVDFWCSDDVVIEQVKRAGVMPMVVKDSVVNHLGSVTLNKQPDDVQTEWKWRNVYIFNAKYGKNKFASHPAYRVWLQNNKDNLEAIYAAQ